MKDIFHYLLIFLVILWPVWVLAFFFLRLLVLKIGSLFKKRESGQPTVPIAIEPSHPVEKPIGT